MRTSLTRHRGLHANQLTGVVPSLIGLLPNLQYLCVRVSFLIPCLNDVRRRLLDNNKLDGTLPSELTKLTELLVL